MTGPRRGQYPAALFWTGQAGDEPETRDNPRLRACPWPPCRATPGRDCTDVRGRPIHGYHDARQALEETT